MPKQSCWCYFSIKLQSQTDFNCRKRSKNFHLIFFLFRNKKANSPLQTKCDLCDALWQDPLHVSIFAPTLWHPPATVVPIAKLTFFSCAFLTSSVKIQMTNWGASPSHIAGSSVLSIRFNFFLFFCHIFYLCVCTCTLCASCYFHAYGVKTN